MEGWAKDGDPWPSDCLKKTFIVSFIPLPLSFFFSQQTYPYSDDDRFACMYAIHSQKQLTCSAPTTSFATKEVPVQIVTMSCQQPIARHIVRVCPPTVVTIGLVKRLSHNSLVIQMTRSFIREVSHVFSVSRWFLEASVRIDHGNGCA